MGFDRRSITLTVPNPAATITGTLNLRSTWCRPIGFHILSVGTDATERLRLTDGDSRVFYLDAADKDYDTAQINTLILNDDTTTGLSVVAQDSVGAAVSAGQAGGRPVIKNPIEVAVINGGTAGDVITVDFDYEYGVFHALTFSLPTAASSAATKSVTLRAKYAQIVGFKALSVGTSVTQILKLTDADSRVVYLDAAATDYDTAAIDKTLVWDDTTTGLSYTPRDATGAAATAASAFQGGPLVRSPITVDLSASEGNDEVVTMTLYYKVA